MKVRVRDMSSHEVIGEQDFEQALVDMLFELAKTADKIDQRLWDLNNSMTRLIEKD
jgi:hypothetical protein